MTYTLRQYLKNTVVITIGSDELWADGAKGNYVEDVNNDAISDEWLARKTSFIWKVGVYTVVDTNKRDWAHAFVGMQRSPEDLPVYLGHFYFQQGENDDCGRVILRMVQCMQQCDIVFDLN